MVRTSRTLAAALLVIGALVALAGCSSSGHTLDGTSWRLSGWTLNSLSPADFTITARFAHGQISGSGGVNTYGGPYKLGPGAAFAVGPLASTEMAGPAAAMRAEGAYMKLLGQARSYKVADGVLTLYDKDGNESLVFAAASK